MYDLSSTKLLIVEDGLEHQDILQRRLQDSVASITMAASKVEALQLLDEHYFHVALLDIKLDGEVDSDNQDGLEIAKAIHDLHDDTSVIMLTGFGTVQRARD